jgi:hypothetical protein
MPKQNGSSENGSHKRKASQDLPDHQPLKKRKELERQPSTPLHWLIVSLLIVFSSSVVFKISATVSHRVLLLSAF